MVILTAFLFRVKLITPFFGRGSSVTPPRWWTPPPRCAVAHLGVVMWLSVKPPGGDEKIVEGEQAR